MDNYISQVKLELDQWKKKMQKKPSVIDKLSKGTQNKFNSMLPDKYHEIVTEAIKNMVKAVLIGNDFIAKEPYPPMLLWEAEDLIRQKIKTHKTTAIIEGAGTGAGGFLLGLADFPLLLTIKIKLLFSIAAIYGKDVKDYRERLFILHIFQLAFSSQAYTNKAFHQIENWDEYSKTLPKDINNFDWRSFQQEYRDYIDLAKLLQLVPGIGAFVGAYVNSKLLDRLGETAMNAYRMRIIKTYKD